MSEPQLRRELTRTERELVRLLERWGRLRAALPTPDASQATSGGPGATSEAGTPGTGGQGTGGQGMGGQGTGLGAAGAGPEVVEWVEGLAAQHRGPLPAETIRAVGRELLLGSRAGRRRPRVAYLGPEFSYSHLAALTHFGSAAELMPVATVAAVFEEIHRGHADFGLAPLENSTDGRIVDTITMFVRRPLTICGEVLVPIHHCLLGTGPRNAIAEVYSKPQALSQCRNWLSEHLPSARLVEMTSTAAAAQVAATKPGAAAVASRDAAAQYGLDLLAENIEDNPNNVTRFAVVGNHAAPRARRSKTALMLHLPHQPGALADAMNIFKRNRLNLSWIESFPLPGARNEYLFFVEFEGHQDEPAAKKTLDKLRATAQRLEILGSYPVAV